MRTLRSDDLVLHNSTGYDEKDLFDFTMACLEYRGALPHPHGSYFKVTFKNHRRYRYRDGKLSMFARVSGLAYVGYPEIRMHLPRVGCFGCEHNRNMNQEIRRRVAQVLIHEIDHTLRLRHKDMIGSSTIKVPAKIMELPIRPREVTDCSSESCPSQTSGLQAASQST